MDTTDVNADANTGQERFTYHLFDRSFRGMCPELSGSEIRVPSDMSAWPPGVLFDALYASIVWHHFGKTDELKKWKNVLPWWAYNRSARRQEESAESTTALGESWQEGNAMDFFDMVMMCPFMAMGPDKTKAYLKECEEMAKTKERKALEEKVDSWRQELA